MTMDESNGDKWLWIEGKVTKLKITKFKGEFQHDVYTCGKHMLFQNQLGQTKVVFNKQGKNAPQCIMF